MRRRWVLAAVALLVLAVGVPVLRHLGSGTGSGAAAAPPPSYDPPATFDDGPGTALPQAADADPLPGVLNGFNAFLATTDGLQVIDTRSGQLRTSISPATRPASGPSTPPPAGPASEPSAEPLDDGADPRPPLLAAFGGRPTVIAAFGVRIAGHGTTVGHDGVRVIGVDAADYATVASARIDLPVSLTGQDALRDAWAVGMSGSRLVIGVQLGPDRTPAGYAIDLAATGSGSPAAPPIWQLVGFTPTAVVGRVVIGSMSDARGDVRVAGVALADGRPVWATGGTDTLTATVWPAGPTLVAVTGTEAGTGRRTLTMLDAGTGAVRTAQDSQGGVSCRYDELSTTICYQALSGDSWVAGFDAGTGRRLWQLPDAAAGRIAPRVSTAWHGLVYGSTDSGTVALDARTGADRPAVPNVAPDLVNAYVGVTAATVSRPRATAHLARS